MNDDPVPSMQPIELLLRVGEREIVVSADMRATETKAAWRAMQAKPITESNR